MSQTVMRKIIWKSGGVVLLDKCLPNISACLRANVLLSRSQVIHKSTKKTNLGQTTVILQDGLDLQEVPTIVQKLKDVSVVSLADFKSHGVDTPETEMSVDSEFSSNRNTINRKSILDGLSRCFSVKGVLHLLASIPEEEKTPKVALLTLKKIIELENDHHYRNRNNREGEEVPLPNYFSRTATMNELVDTIACSSDTDLLLEGLKAISYDVSGEKNSKYKERLIEEALIRATNGKFTILQMCEVAKVFSSLKCVKKDDVDKLWVGIVDKDEEISESNINELFRILPMFEQSRNMLLKILEKRITNVWWRLSGKTVADAMLTMHEIKTCSQRVMIMFSRWTTTNIHVASEDDVLHIVKGFSTLEYNDSGVRSALEQFVKAKGLHVKNPAVLAAIMEYCTQFRIRSNYILEGCGEYFIEHGNSLSPQFVKSFLIPYGLLDYNPPNGFKFWKVAEKVMEINFIQFRPEDALDLMLTCVYLEKHPFNFIKKIFNPYFLDRLHSTTDQIVHQLLRTKLKLFDTAMTLECPNYRGPLLPKDHSAKSLWQDGRIKRMVNNVFEPLTRIAGGADMLTTSVVLGQLPTMGLYVIDVLFHPKGMGTSILPFNLRRDPNVYVAILIHPPEHYCAEGKYLLGPQIMRKRHLRKLGLKVVDLEYNQLAKLKVHPQALESYLVQKIRTAERAL